ncbi:MAG: flavin reductase family protein [Eubacterium sp.]|nr:flavin reductase family protein [Eubacterium sp.]
MSLEYFDGNPFEKIGGGFALTTECDGKVNSMTAAWGGLGVMWGKNVAYVVVRDSRYTKEILDKTDKFSMTFFADDDKNSKMLLKYFGAVSGRDEDKIKVSRITIDRYNDVPYIDEGVLVFICKKLFCSPMTKDNYLDKAIYDEYYPTGDNHNIYIAEIEMMLAR